MYDLEKMLIHRTAVRCEIDISQAPKIGWSVLPGTRTFICLYFRIPNRDETNPSPS